VTGPATPPAGWDREIPKYRATRNIKPALKARYRFEPPFAKMEDSDEWQYGEKPIYAREEIATKEWPHPSFFPLNYSAGRVLDFFNTRVKSRLTRSPWRGDRIHLDDGLAGPTQPNIAINSGVTAA
jgi:hypothetical protein